MHCGREVVARKDGSRFCEEVDVRAASLLICPGACLEKVARAAGLGKTDGAKLSAGTLVPLLAPALARPLHRPLLRPSRGDDKTVLLTPGGWPHSQKPSLEDKPLQRATLLAMAAAKAASVKRCRLPGESIADPRNVLHGVVFLTTTTWVFAVFQGERH